MSAVTTIGDDLFARDETGRLRSRIATIFPRAGVLVTLPGIHATQRCEYTDWLNARRVGGGEPPLSVAEEEQVWAMGVDLVLEEDGVVLIRPDPHEMELAFEADDLLQQQKVSKRKILFLHVIDPRVGDAIRRRGECWRITPLPRSPLQMRQMIVSSKIAIGGHEIYYYDKPSGARLLTCGEFSSLKSMPDEDLRLHLIEIRDYSRQTNRAGRAEIDFFASTDKGLAGAFAAVLFEDLDPLQLRLAYDTLRRRFMDAVPAELLRDDIECPPWRSQMFAALMGQTDRAVSEESLLGLAAEFYMQVEWLPGGRIEDGEVILDSLFEEEAEDTHTPAEQRICDERARGFIFNFIRDYGDLEYFNIGRIVGSLSARKGSLGKRGVYVAEIKLRASASHVLRIIRMQKWGVTEHLDEGKDLLRAILECEEYTEYILDRRMGCRQLGMSLPPRTTARKVNERYWGPNRRYTGISIWSAYFERDYVSGVATDKLPPAKLADPRYAVGLARLLGRAAAPNLIVGRSDIKGQVIFDDGDELVIEDANGLPAAIIVADHTGTFGDFRRTLLDLCPAYADCLNRRIDILPDRQAFADAFLMGFIERFGHIRHEYARRKRAFDTLFKHQRRDEGGSFAYRWECVLARLQVNDPVKLADRIRENMRV